MNIMFVCTGNTCRSVMAHYYAAKRALDLGLEVRVTSCGLAVDAGIQMPGIIKRLFAREGIPETSHIPRQIDAALVAGADLILVMTSQHRTKMAELFPEAAAKTHELIAYAGLGNGNVADPYGQGEAVYFNTFRLIKKSVDLVFNGLQENK